VFFMGRKKFAVVPPAGKAWLKDVFSKEGLRIIGSLAVIYFFVACFWSLWDQSNGQTWTLQAESSLMDKNLGFGFTLLPAQIQVVNGLFILGMVPIFTFGVYPLMGKLFKVTPLRKIGIGLFTIASSFLIVARIEAHIQAGQTVSMWWQILAYVVLTASEVLVSITALEFSYKQAPLRMKSFIMALFLLSTFFGNMMTAGVNRAMIKPLHATGVETGAETWVAVDDAKSFVVGQKIDIAGENGVSYEKHAADGKVSTAKLAGTFLVQAIDAEKARVELMDVVNRQAVKSEGAFDASKAEVSTYKLVGPQYFNFFALMMAIVGVIYIFFAMFYKEKTHVREEGNAAAA
jgi:POT family proton-dependent oligopeptide transporter